MTCPHYQLQELYLIPFVETMYVSLKLTADCEQQSGVPPENFTTETRERKFIKTQLGIEPILIGQCNKTGETVYCQGTGNCKEGYSLKKQLEPYLKGSKSSQNPFASDTLLDEKSFPFHIATGELPPSYFLRNLSRILANKTGNPLGSSSEDPYRNRETDDKPPSESIEDKLKRIKGKKIKID